MEKLTQLLLPILIFIATLAGGLSTVQAQEPDLTDGLVAHWDMDELSSIRTDSHASYDLTDNNTVGYATGKINNAAQFVNGNNEYLSIDSADFQFSGDFTIAAWVYFDTRINSVSSDFVNYSNGSNDGWRLWLRDHSNDSWRFSAGDGSSNTFAQISASASDGEGEWNFFIAGYDATSQQVFLQKNNGTTVYNTFAGPISYSASILSFGEDFSGRLDSVSIWNRVLTDTEITTLYNDGNGLDYNEFDPYRTIVNVSVNFTPTIIVSPTFSLTPTIAISPSFNITNNVILTDTTPYTSITNPHTDNEIHIERVYTHGDIAIAVPVWFLLLMAVYWRVQIVVKGK